MIKQAENLLVQEGVQVLIYLTKYFLLQKVKRYLIQLVVEEQEETKQLTLDNLK